MRRKFIEIQETVYSWLASRKFLIFILSIFILQTVWLALSAWRLPYDEYYHLGIINFYAGQWSPFIETQPVDTALYGDLIRLPSYMYHYVMSFPYRFLTGFIQNEMLLVFTLRLINIGLVVGAILLFRKLFLEAGFTKRRINTATTLFLFTPMVAVLAAQSNYDNLILLLTPLVLRSAYRMMTGPITLERVVVFLSLGMFGSLVKHSFLLIFFALTAVVFLSSIKRRGSAFQIVRIKNFFAISHRSIFIGTSLIFLVVSLLFVERHVINAVRYRQINVNCAAVHSRDFCIQYSPWRRNENEKALKQAGTEEPLFGNPASFGVHWVSTMARGLFAVFANIPNTTETAQEDPYGHYAFKPLLPVITLIGYGGVLLGAGAIILNFKSLWAHPFNRLILMVSIGLLLALFVFNYNTYRRIGRPYAIQVRYMYPLILPLCLVAIEAVGVRLKSRTIKIVATTMVVGLFIYSGAVLGWIIRSEPSWYIQSDTIIHLNQSAQNVLKKLIIH